MANYWVNYSCGHGGKNMQLYGKVKDRENKIEWMEANMLCPDCYKASLKEQGLTLEVNLDPYNKEYPVVLCFIGDSYSFKDKIKALNYQWGDRPSTGVFGAFDLKIEKAWHKYITIDTLNEEIEKAKELGAEIVDNIKPIDVIALKEAMKIRKKEKAEKEELIKQIPKPIVPKKLSGARWNNTVYGKSGNYCYYNDGEKVYLTDDEAAEIEQYVKDKIEYKAKIKAIEDKILKGEI